MARPAEAGNGWAGQVGCRRREFARQVRVLATWMRSLGIAPGDRVVAYLPNTPEAIIAMYATASIGAVWSSCGPDFGARGVLDRYAQLTPKLIFCVDGYSYGGKLFGSDIKLADLDCDGDLDIAVYVEGTMEAA